MEFKEGQKAIIVGTPKTAHGHAAAIQAGTARWSSSDESVVSVEQDPTNELGAVLHALDGSNNESVIIEVRADGDPSEGVRELIGTLAVTCTQGDAAVFDIDVVSIEDDGSGSGEQPAPTEPADTPADNAGSGDAAGNAGDLDAAGPGTVTEPADTPGGTGTDGGTVEAGDPGTATGDPIPAPNPNDTTPGAGDPTADPDANNVGGPGSEPIAGSDTAGADNPVEGTEADSAVPGGDEVSSPSNLPGTGGNAF